MNAVGFTLTLLAVLAVVAGTRKWAALGVLGAVCLITQGQALDIAGFHFHAIRIVLLAGLLRVIAKGELRRVEWNGIDGALFFYAALTVTVWSLRTGVWQEAVGTCYNTVLSYIVFRCLITSWEELEEFAAGVAVLMIPVAACMVLQSLTGDNLFSVMGGNDWADYRAGRVRCVGAFRGPHTAGAFGATWLPIFAGLYYVKVGRRWLIMAGLVATLAIVYTSNSSGPLTGLLAAFLGLAFWKLRGKMRKVRWGIVVFLVVMGIGMKAPIWYISAKFADIIGGDGWYRSFLMEQCYNHISDWWLMGTNDTSQWGSTLMDWGGADLCNMFVSCAAGAGLGGLVLFILVLKRCFRNLGLARRKASEGWPKQEVILWCLGSALFAHVVILFSVTYWDQMQVAWWGFLAMVSSGSAAVLKQAETVEHIESEVPVPQEGVAV